MKRLFLGIFLSLIGIFGHPASMRADQVYQATDTLVDPSSPPYGMSMPGFFNGRPGSFVVFSFTQVTFTEFGHTQTALLQGAITVLNDNPPGNDPHYNLNVTFNRVLDTSGIQNYNPHYRYYTIQTNGVEMVNATNPNDVTQLATFPQDNSMPFQVGNGANNFNSGFGGAGWLAFIHQFNGKTITGDTEETHGDFVMDLTPVSEPSTLAMALSGLAGVGLAVRRRWTHS